MCALAEQLVNALNLRFNNNGEYEEDSKEVSRKWLEQIANIGVLFDFQSTLSPHLVRLSDIQCPVRSLEFEPVAFVLQACYTRTTACAKVTMNWWPKNDTQESY